MAKAEFRLPEDFLAQLSRLEQRTDDIMKPRSFADRGAAKSRTS